MAHYATGSGTWNDTNLEIWYMDAARTIPATTVPTNIDDVVIDNLTGSISLSSTAGVCVCRNITTSVAFSFTGTNGWLYIHGNISMGGNLNIGRSCACYLYGVSKTITSNSFIISCGYGFSIENGASYSLNDAFTANFSIYFRINTSGSLTTNNHNVTCTSNLYWLGVVNAGTSTITCMTTSAGTAGDFRITNASTNISQATIVCHARNTINITRPCLSLTVNGVSTTTPETFTATAPTTLVINGALLALAGNTTCTNLTLEGTQTNRTLLTSSVEFTRRTLTVNGTLSVSNTILRNITGAGSASWNLSAGTDIGDAGYNSGITFPAPRNMEWVATSGGTWNDTASWQQKVLQFDGTNDYIRLANKITWFDDARNPWTVQLVMVDVPINDNNVKNIISNYSGGQIKGFRIATYQSSVLVTLRNVNTTNNIQVSTTLPSIANTVVTVTYDGSMSANGINVYYNNILQTKTISANNLTTYDISSPYVLSTTISGSWANTSTVTANYYIGKLSNMKVWSSVVSPTAQNPDLLDLRMDYSVGDVVKDYSPAGNNGTMYNFTQPSCWVTTSALVPLPQDNNVFNANSITSGSSSIIIDHYLIAGEIQSANMLNTPTLVTTESDVRFIKSIDLSGFGTLNSNKIWYIYNEADATIKGSGTQTIYDLRTYQTINSALKVSFKSNFAITTLYGRNVVDCEGNTITVANYYNVLATATLNLNAVGKLIITTVGRWSQALTTTGEGCLELNGSGSPYLDNYTATGTISHTINRLCINCSGTADIRRSTASTGTTTYNINKLTFVQADKALTFYGEGGANGNVRLVIGEVVTAGGNSITASNGQGRVSITTANKNLSKVLDFGNAALTNIAAQDRNTVYTTGTVTNCTGVINRAAFLKGLVFFNNLVRSKIGGFFAEDDFNNHEIN